MAARALGLLLLIAVGCRSAPPQSGLSRNPNPYRPILHACGELEYIPGRPLLAITRKQCVALALERGRIGGELLSAQIGALSKTITEAEVDRFHTAELEPPLELLRVVEDMTAAVDRDYWSLRAAYGIYLCRTAAANAAREFEAASERLFAAGRLTRIELEKVRQTRIAADQERELALHGTSDVPGLLEAEIRLRTTIGTTDDLPGLLLPCDTLPTLDPQLDSCARQDLARTHRLVLVSARYRILAAGGEVDAAKGEDRPKALAKLEQARASYIECDRFVSFEIESGLQRFAAATRNRELATERKLSANRQAGDLERLSREGAAEQADVFAARIRLAGAAAEEHQAIVQCCLAATGVDRATGLLLIRDGIQMPTPERASPPRAIMPTPPPPTVREVGGIIPARLSALVSADPLAPLPEFLASLLPETAKSSPR
jgi:hypothetical protein